VTTTESPLVLEPEKQAFRVKEECPDLTKDLTKDPHIFIWGGDDLVENVFVSL
jgi:hypothetical protein